MQFIQLAPMQELSDSFFMNSYHKVFGGFTQMMMPYILADRKSPKKTLWLKKHFAEVNSEIDLIPQLLSNDAEALVEISNILFDYGYEHININLGCPFRFVTKKGRGSGLLPHPDKIDKLLSDAMPHLKPKLSVKVRLGLTDKDEILPIIDILNNYPIYQTIIHPRTATQKYTGYADKDYFYKIMPRLNMPVVYNGDILQKKHVDEITKNCPSVKGVMIGRGALINPFITTQINGIEFSENEKREKYKELYSLLYNFYKGKVLNEKFFLHRMKALWFYFSESFCNGKEYLKDIKTANTLTDFNKITNKILDEGQFLY